MLKIKIIIFFACLIRFGFAQDLEKDLLEIKTAFDTAQHVSLKANANVYQSKGGGKLYSVVTSLNRSGKIMHTSLGDMEFFVNLDFFVQVDHEDKMVTVAKMEKNKPISDVKSVDFDELLKYLDKDDVPKKPIIQYVPMSNGLKKYIVKSTNGDVNEITITLSLEKKSIVEIIYEYSANSEYNSQYVVVNYTVFDLVNCDMKKLNIGNYFTQVGPKKILQGSYKSYELIEAE